MSNRLYIYINKEPYDVTDFIDEHPGGKQCILNKIGKDCTIDYNWHSKNGKKLWKEFLVTNNNDNKKIKESKRNAIMCNIV